MSLYGNHETKHITKRSRKKAHKTNCLGRTANKSHNPKAQRYKKVTPRETTAYNRRVGR